MATMTARQGQHDLIQFLKNPRLRDRYFSDNTPPIKEKTDAKDAQESGPTAKEL